MPELPEVETIKNFLLPQIKDKTIDHVEVLRPAQVLNDVRYFVSSLKGETFLDLTRYGKYLFFHLTNDKVIISHLRMEGKYYYMGPKEPLTIHARIVFYLKNGDKLVYDDSRCFGIMKLTSEENYMNEKEIKKLGKEPFKWTLADILKQKPKSGLLKAMLLDQTFVCGIGNIYADEICYDVHLRPDFNINQITNEKWEEIIISARKILNESIKQNGSTIRSYHPTKEKNGGFQNQLKVYGHGDEKCPCCGSTFKKTRIAGRGTTYCPLCQSRDDNRLIIGLTGPSGMGKSTVLEHLKDQGYPTISSDEIVKDLYKRKDVIERLNKEFNTHFKNKVDKAILKEMILKDERNKTILEEIIHPLVKEEIITFIDFNQGIIIVEVPLLYESHMENMFDIILAVHSSNQDQFLEKREQENASTIKKINANNKFASYSKLVDHLFENNGTKEDLYASVDEYFNKVQSILNHKSC